MIYVSSHTYIYTHTLIKGRMSVKIFVNTIIWMFINYLIGQYVKKKSETYKYGFIIDFIDTHVKIQF